MQLVKTTPTEAMQLGKVFFDSKLFKDLQSAQQAVVKIMAGAEIGIPPFAAISGIHIIQGKPTIGAGLMASTIKGSAKYDYRVVQSTELVCSIDFFEGKEKIGNSTFTIEDAKKAGTQNLNKFPKNMLFARAISNGVKWFTPDIFSGPVYVPEEMEQVTVEADAEIVEVMKQATDQQLIKAIERYDAGELDIFYKLKSKLTLTDQQQERINLILNAKIDNNEKAS